MDWFERLTGFQEGNYADTRAKLRVGGETLISTVNGRCYGIGSFELVSVQTLRDRVATLPAARGQLRTSHVQCDVRQLHQSAEYAGAIFQAASQFNCLEMVAPSVTPEHGVTKYQNDRSRDLPAPSPPGQPRSSGITSSRSATRSGKHMTASSMA